jgi:hypothetical protein
MVSTVQPPSLLPVNVFVSVHFHTILFATRTSQDEMNYEIVCQAKIKLKQTNELDEMMKHRNVINYVKAQRLSWFGHINRIPETTIVKKI